MAPTLTTVRTQDGELIDLKEIARLLFIGVTTAERRKAARGLPQHIVLGATLHRWRRKDILDWIEMGCPSRAAFEAAQAQRAAQRRGR
jgi:predicted DNA-binding transcriptional regulator AlpA